MKRKSNHAEQEIKHNAPQPQAWLMPPSAISTSTTNVLSSTPPNNNRIRSYSEPDSFFASIAKMPSFRTPQTSPDNLSHKSYSTENIKRSLSFEFAMSNEESMQDKSTLSNANTAFGKSETKTPQAANSSNTFQSTPKRDRFLSAARLWSSFTGGIGGGFGDRLNSLEHSSENTSIHNASQQLSSLKSTSSIASNDNDIDPFFFSDNILISDRESFDSSGTSLFSIPSEKMSKISSHNQPPIIPITATNPNTVPHMMTPLSRCSKYCPRFINTSSITRSSSFFVVRHAPCFLCCAGSLGVSVTDRVVLFRLNILCALFALVQLCVGVFLSGLMYGSIAGIDFSAIKVVDVNTTLIVSDVDADIEEISEVDWDFSVSSLFLDPNLWNLNFSLIILGLVALVLLMAMIFTRKVIKDMDLNVALVYLTVLRWIIPIQIFLVLTLLDVHRVTAVWVKHWWRSKPFALVRKQFCGSDADKCSFPIGENETEWCLREFNMTDCESIRLKAQKSMTDICYAFYIGNFIWGVLLIILIFLSKRALEGIITYPIVQAKREGNIACWFTLPILGCAALGWVLLSHLPSELLTAGNLTWVGITYFIAGGSFLFNAMLGTFISKFSVLSTMDNKKKAVGVTLFIIISMITVISVGLVLAFSIFFTIELNLSIAEDLRSRIACVLDTSGSCTFCPDSFDTGSFGPNVCPEWTVEDVSKIIHTVFYQSACCAGMLFLYAFDSVRFGFVLRRHINHYQIEYV